MPFLTIAIIQGATKCHPAVVDPSTVNRKSAIKPRPLLGPSLPRLTALIECGELALFAGFQGPVVTGYRCAGRPSAVPSGHTAALDIVKSSVVPV